MSVTGCTPTIFFPGMAGKMFNNKLFQVQNFIKQFNNTTRFHISQGYQKAVD